MLPILCYLGMPQTARQMVDGLVWVLWREHHQAGSKYCHDYHASWFAGGRIDGRRLLKDEGNVARQLKLKSLAECNNCLHKCATA